MPQRKTKQPAISALDRRRAELTAKFFRGLGDPTRLRIIELLVQRPMTVSEIVAALKQPQGRVSSHLACLRWCGFVSGQPRGRHVQYSVTDPRVTEVLSLARSMLAEHAANLEACTRIDDASQPKAL